MLKKLFGKVLEDNEEEEEKEVSRQESEVKPKPNKKHLVIAGLIFLLALAVRLYFLFVIEDPQNAHPGWYEDTYHHWQVAYLSYQIGFKQSYLRLWDLKGMEYFWGLLHPLVLGALMSLFRTSSIIVARLLSSFCGSLSLGLVFLIVERFFGWKAALAASLIGIINPVGIYSDASGMQEPLGILMFLTGLYFWPIRAVLTGVFFMLAGMVRAEYWLLALGLTMVIFLTKEKFERKILYLFGFGSLMLFYLKYLLDKTGNAIYPMYWNFMGNMKGEWQAKVLPNLSQQIVQKIYIGVLISVAIYGVWLVLKRPKYFLFFSLGLGNWAILGLSVGLSKYLLSYLPRFWVDRIMILPYLFLGIWFSVLVFQIFKKGWFSILGWLLVIGVIGGSLFAWRPIWYWRLMTGREWENKKALAEAVAKYYQGGRILFFENHPATTYWLIYNCHIKAENLVSQMYDPYYYLPKDPYENWGENRKVVLNWLIKEKIQLLPFSGSDSQYSELVKREQDYFKELAYLQELNLYLYEFKPEAIEK